LLALAKSRARPTASASSVEAINLRALSDHWIELLRLAMSIKTGTVTASVILRKLSAYPRQNGLALALRELGKLGRTLFTLEWLQDPELTSPQPRRAQQGRAAKCASPCGVLQPAR
jgi:TnpA family transposase